MRRCLIGSCWMASCWARQTLRSLEMVRGGDAPDVVLPFAPPPRGMLCADAMIVCVSWRRRGRAQLLQKAPPGWSAGPFHPRWAAARRFRARPARCWPPLAPSRAP